MSALTDALRRSRLDEAHHRLERERIGHAMATLLVLAHNAYIGPDTDDRPRGHIVASSVWLQGRARRSEPTITEHLRLLIEADEVAVWKPHDRRNGRAREYVVLHLATRRGRALAERCSLMNRPKPRTAPPKTKGQYPKPTMGTEPLPTARSEGS